MTTVLSQKGQVVIPSAVRERLSLEAGDDMEILIEDEDTIVLRRISRRPNEGLVDHLVTCPEPFDIPERSTEEAREVDLAL
ncbi:MAG: AbrB/MazE/SpoVT family DNA-binding domain-containing protein [Verrucomicrobiales bacterium]|nr:AbrB/MazE/SpoVT family DNA-binding domain-containing protein [Verrucomicrobiales bacterium]